MARVNFKNFTPRPKPKRDQGYTRRIKINQRNECLKNIIDRGDNGDNRRTKYNYTT